MEQKNRTLNIQKTVMYTLFFLTFAVMMAVGTFKDLEIEKSLFNYQNSFARFTENYGCLPIDILRLLAFSVLFCAYHKVDDALDIAQSFMPFIGRIRDNKIIRKLIFILHHIIYALFLYGAFCGSDEFLSSVLRPAAGGNIQELMIGNGIPRIIAVAVWTAVRIALLVLVLFLVRKIDKKHMKALEFMAVAGLILYYGSDIINVMKEHFHRVRFREMVAYSHALIDANGMSSRGNADMPREWAQNASYYAYTPWYKVGNDYGVFSESNSFPSGHTASAVFTMLLSMLAAKSKKATKLFIPSFLIGFAYTLMIGTMRLVSGAHYMTDNSAAAIIMFAMTVIVVGIMNKLERHSDRRVERIRRRRERDEMRNKLKTSADSIEE